MTVWFHDDDTPSASLADRCTLFPTKLCCFPSTWSRKLGAFPFTPLPPLPLQPDGRAFREVTLSHICDHALGSAIIYSLNYEASDVAYHFVYDG